MVFLLVYGGVPAPWCKEGCRCSLRYQRCTERSVQGARAWCTTVYSRFVRIDARRQWYKQCTAGVYLSVLTSVRPVRTVYGRCTESVRQVCTAGLYGLRQPETA